jgi:hypothetical protein
MSTPQGQVIARPEQKGTFWSIERVVTFVVGPFVVAGTGWLSTFFATRLGISISQEAIMGIYATGSVSAAALIYKWLHGRQNPELIKIEALTKAGLGHLIPVMHTLEAVTGTHGLLGIGEQQAEKTLFGALKSASSSDPVVEQAIEEARQRFEEVIHPILNNAVKEAAGTAAVVTAPPMMGSKEGVAPESGMSDRSEPAAEPLPPIPTSPNDPAPPTPPGASQATEAAPAADQGAASAGA